MEAGSQNSCDHCVAKHPNIPWGIPTIEFGDGWEQVQCWYSFGSVGAGLPALGGRGQARQDIMHRLSRVRPRGLDAIDCPPKDQVGAMQTEGNRCPQ